MKQDHRTYTRAQLDRQCMIAIRNAVKLYNCSFIMCLMNKGLSKDEILEITKDSESIFASIKNGTLSFDDCIDDIKTNVGIEVQL